MHSLLAVDVRLDLTPERVAGSAAGKPDLADGRAGLSDEFQAVPHRVCRPFEHGPDHVGSAVADGQADPGPLGVGVVIGGAFAGQIRQEEQALGARTGHRGLVVEQLIGVDAPDARAASTSGPGPVWLRIPLERLPPAARTTPITHQAPGTAWQPRWSRPSGSKPGSDGVGEDDAGGPHRRRNRPLRGRYRCRPPPPADRRRRRRS